MDAYAVAQDIARSPSGSYSDEVLAPDSDVDQDYPLSPSILPRTPPKKDDLSIKKDLVIYPALYIKKLSQQ